MVSAAPVTQHHPALQRAPVLLFFLGITLNQTSVLFNINLSIADFFALLLLVFTITAREPADVLFVANFLALLVAPAVYVALVPEPRSPGLPLLLVALCTVGACVTGIVAVNDLVLRGESRSMGIAMGINLVPRFALTLGFVGLAGLFLTTSRWRLLFYAGPLASIVTTFLTASRGGAVAIPLLFGLALLFLVVRSGDTDTATRLSGMAQAIGYGIAAVGPVVVGVDPGDPLPEVIDFGFRAAASREVGVRLVAAFVPAPGEVDLGQVRGALADAVQRRTQEIEQLAQEWRERYPGVPVELEMTEADAVDTLADAVEDAAVLVVGSRGRRGLVGKRLGSVAQSLVHVAPVVTVLPIHA